MKTVKPEPVLADSQSGIKRKLWVRPPSGGARSPRRVCRGGAELRKKPSAASQQAAQDEAGSPTWSVLLPRPLRAAVSF